MNKNKEISRFKLYCRTSFNSLKSNLYLWKEDEYKRPLTRIFYNSVYDCGKVNKSTYISGQAIVDMNNKIRTVEDHFLSPQMVAKMILDNSKIYLNDYKKYESIFWNCCETITVSKEENIKLSLLNKKTNTLIATSEKYDHLGIKLFKQEKINNEVRYNPVNSDCLSIPNDIILYEKVV